MEKKEKKKGGVRKAKRKEAAFGLFWALNDVIGFVGFTVFPLALAIVSMFVSMRGYQLDTIKWVGLANFKEVLGDPKFWISLRNTMGFAMVNMVALGIGIVTALILSQKYRGTNFFKALFFVPNICSSVAVTMIWMAMFNEEFGIINDALMRMFGEGAKVGWYSKALPFFLMIFIIMLWQAPGYGIVMLNAALTNVPRELNEAAAIDGATRFQQLRYVSLPTIRPTIFYLFINGLIGGFQEYGIPLLVSSTLGNGWTGAAGPNNAGLSTMLYIYNTGVLYGDMPKATVMSFFLFWIVFIFIMANFMRERRMNND